MEAGFDFRELFILDLANNHQGSVEHGRTIIRSMADVVNKHGARAALKFQFRQLDTFIHPDHQEGSDLKYIQRFVSTRLEREQFQELLDEVWARGLLAMCTPFDEESVGVIVDMGFDLIKVGSCSAEDWPLLEEVASAGKPVVVSTGGLGIDEIDSVVSFLQHRAAEFAIMHCVSIYPTPDERCNLNQIEAIGQRYPNTVIGWSTHENPDDTVPVQIAVAKGARMFERHVGLETDKIKLNAYSSTSEQLDRWFAAYHKARGLCGADERPAASEEESAAIADL
ncbi:MAG: N-acetylneuraminate synthase family protein, partial [Proteobacteria bacterium]|nr:N-acetylneuraminate synthase family protein [Pseudomonadota bacterium]